MTGVSGLGSWPPADPVEAQSIVMGRLADLPDGLTGLPYLLRTGEQPFRDPVGHGVGLLDGLVGELGPHGWALADRPGRDQIRAKAAVGASVDAVGVAALGYQGSLVIPLIGPISLAAALWMPRGDRAVADLGASRELAESLAAGIAGHISVLAQTLPGCRFRVVLVEPALGRATNGQLPTFSGYGRIRPLDKDAAVERIAVVVEEAKRAGSTEVVVHLGTVEDLEVVSRFGADGVGIDPDSVDSDGWERVAEYVERGGSVWGRMVSVSSRKLLVDGWLRVGLPASGLVDVVVTGGEPVPLPAQAKAALDRLVTDARRIADVASQ